MGKSIAESRDDDVNSDDCCNSRKCSIISEIILLIIGIGAVVQIFFVPDAIETYFEEKLSEQFVITSDTEESNNSIWTHWVSNEFDDSPAQLFSYTLFNITNPWGVLNGDIANLTEMGPFVFRRYEYRVNPIFTNNDTFVEYRYEYKYIYQEDLSTTEYSLNEPITIINPALQTFIFGMNTIYGNIKETVFDEYFEKLPPLHAFYITTVYNALWNTSDKTMEEYYKTYFIDINTKNSAINYASNYVVEYTGNDNLNNLRKLVRFFNKTSMEFWGCFNETQISNNSEFWERDRGNIYYQENCNSNETIYGSRETKQFPYNNWIKKNTQLTTWALEKYRKVHYVFDKEVTEHGIPMYKFKLRDDVFANATNAPVNNKYYQFGFDGLLNITARNSDPLRQTVIYMSKSHFLDAPYYVDEVNRRTGLRDPDRDLDDQWMVIEPRTGVVFHRYLAYQANLNIYPLYNKPNQSFINITEQIIPNYALVVNAHATDDQYNTLKSNLNTLDTTIDISIYGGASLAIVCFIILLYLCHKRNCRNQQQNEKELLKEEEGAGTKYGATKRNGYAVVV